MVMIFYSFRQKLNLKHLYIKKKKLSQRICDMFILSYKNNVYEEYYEKLSSIYSIVNSICQKLQIDDRSKCSGR